ncbi:hypothetical protein U713_01425 [Rhodobacter capsulatus YW2]|nr:hypothetical protein U713_01425 [Rhodobacter capsulatus YW2]
MKMRPAPEVPIFASDEIPNFVTRTTKQLHKKLEVARMKNLIREIIARGISKGHSSCDSRD